MSGARHSRASGSKGATHAHGPAGRTRNLKLTVCGWVWTVHAGLFHAIEAARLPAPTVEAIEAIERPVCRGVWTLGVNPRLTSELGLVYMGTLIVLVR